MCIRDSVEVGQKVNVGDTLCIVEAMKMMNQIEADKSGVVKAILILSLIHIYQFTMMDASIAGNGRLLVQSRPAAAEHLFNQRTPADVTASFLR